jgi:hypothetical protein
MSLGWWYASVELGGGGRRWDEGQIGMCADGPGAVKGGRETWTEGIGGRVTGRGGWHLGHRQAQVYMGVTVLTESRRRTCESSRAQEDLADSRSRTAVTRVECRRTRMEYTTRGQFCGLGLKPSVAGFAGLGLKTRAEVPRRNRRHVAASRSSHRGEAISWRARWPSDEDYLGLDHNTLGLCGLTQNI